MKKAIPILIIFLSVQIIVNAQDDFNLPKGQVYIVKNQWGGSGSGWNAGGAWILGSRSGQPVVSISMTSNDGGNSLSGTMKYQNEGPIRVRASRTEGNYYRVENQWGSTGDPWQYAGSWLIGGRCNQQVVSISINSNDGGQTFNGSMTYQNEGPIMMRATMIKW